MDPMNQLEKTENSAEKNLGKLIYLDDKIVKLLTNTKQYSSSSISDR